MTLVNDGVGLFCGGGVQLVRDLHSMQVRDGTAAGTYKVDMGIDVAVVALDSVHGAHADDQPLLLEQGDVAVDRAERQVGDLLLQRCVDRFSRGVLVGTAQVGQDRIPLSEALCTWLHRHHPFGVDL